MMKQLYLSLFFGKRFYRLMAAVIFLFVLAYPMPFLFGVATAALVLLMLVTAADFILLFYKAEPLSGRRMLPERFSNGDENRMQWEIGNHYPLRMQLRLTDEFPEVWQIRNFERLFTLEPAGRIRQGYVVVPKTRGAFSFGDFYVFAKSPLRLIVRRIRFPMNETIRVYPGFLRLRQLEFMSHITDPGNTGYKQVRKTGHSQEFEQIREYVSGDDIRSINWKATGRTGGQMMMNVYTDEKSQPVYCIIDKGRTMKMAFEGLSLLDYAVNASLAMSGVAISKQDKAGIISFGDSTGDFLPANHRPVQMSAIVNSLYNLKTKFLESDFAFLHRFIKMNITQRSLLILFTNFESLAALNRQLPYLRNIARKHLLLVVFFENTSLRRLASGEVKTTERLYEKVIAEKFMLDKKLITKELQRFGIAALLTTPENLSVDTVNKYLQIKARREI